MKVPAGLLVLMLAASVFSCSTPSAAGSFVVFGPRQVVPRNSITVQFYVEKNLFSVRFRVNEGSGLNQIVVVCPAEKWEWETVRKTATALAPRMEKDDAIDPLPLLTSLGLKGCQLSDS